MVVNIYRYCTCYTSGDVSHQTISGYAVSVFAWGVSKRQEKFGIPAVLIEIRVGHFQNTSLDLYLYHYIRSSVFVIFFFLPWRNSSQWAKASSMSRIHHHTLLDTPHSVGLPVRVISPTQRTLPDSTQHSKQTDINALRGIRTHNPSKRVAADLRLRPRSHWDWLFVTFLLNILFLYYIVTVD